MTQYRGARVPRPPAPPSPTPPARSAVPVLKIAARSEFLLRRARCKIHSLTQQPIDSLRLIHSLIHSLSNPFIHQSLVHTSDVDESTKFHTNPVKRRRNRRKQTFPFPSVPSLFYRFCMEFRASVSVSAPVSVASVNQA